jgi:hypothetical protein
MKAYGQALALGKKASAQANDGKRHLCGLDQQDHRKLGTSVANHSKGKTRHEQRSVERQAAKRRIREELQ